MNQLSWLCSACGKNQAVSCCCCANAETLLCEVCIGPHFSKNPFQTHTNIPAMAHGQHASPGYLDRLEQRAGCVPKAKIELLKNLESVEACITEFNSKIESVISALREYAQRKTAQLKQMKADLENSINATVLEVEQSMYLDNPPFKNKLARYMRLFKTESQELKVFNYEIDKAQYPASLSGILRFTLNITSGDVPDFPLKFLPGFNGNSLRLYDFTGGKTRTIFLSKTFTDGTTYCVPDPQTILCLGAKPASPEVDSLTLADFEITPLPSMIGARCYCGVIKHGDFVYVFGGNVPNNTSCEKLSLEGGTWTALQNMRHPRYAFSPAEFMGEVYLPDSYQAHKAIESFNLVTETFKTLPISLLPLSGNSVSFIENGELVIITRTKQIGKWQIQSAETKFRVSQIEVPVTNPLSNIRPIVVGGKALWVIFNTGNLMKFSLDSDKFT